MMERCTRVSDAEGGQAVAYVVGDAIAELPTTPPIFVGEAVNRLAAYEDTGLTPEEVAKLARSEGCEYCRERKPILDDAGKLQIDDSDGSIWYIAQVAADDIYEDHTNIRFCPMCGRKLNN